MIKTRIFLYNSENESNDYRGEELSSHLLQGDYLKEDVSDTLDVGEITLQGLTRREEFEPETKFIIDIYDVRTITIEGQEVVEENLKYHWNMCVEKDVVEQPILSDNNYFNHSISLIEPSVVAQKRLVDNISVTYKLKNVNLKTTPIFDINQESQTENTPSAYTPSENFGNYSTGFLGYYTNSIWGKHFQLDGNIQMLTRSQSASGSTKLYQNVANYNVSEEGEEPEYYAKFKIPKVKIYFGVQNSKSFTYIGDASLHYVIQEFDLNDYINPTRTWEADVISNSNLNTGNSNYPLRMNEASIPSQYNRAEWLIENASYIAAAPSSNVYVRRYTDTFAQNPTYLTQEIQILQNKRYNITIYLKEFDNSFSNSYGGGTLGGGFVTSTKNIVKFGKYWKGALEGGRNFSFTGFSQNELQTTCSFQTYATDSKGILLQSANPYNALSLLQKAILNTQLVRKQSGIFIGDINSMNLPFYIDEDWLTELQNTQVIEMFYNQKNLWEVLLEVGKYIHAVPNIIFGVDDRFKISFDKLGETNESENKNQTSSIINFKGVDDYVSACSSYITNMVQLGGYIDEWVAPKTTNENALVYNDTCSILVSKPIIEILNVEVKCIAGSYDFADVGDIVDMTNFIYENNVYALLSVYYSDYPNKGVALNYKLGTNEIGGCYYKSPTENSGDPQDDYAIKKIIYYAFSGGVPDVLPTTSHWKNIKVNDFIFHITYRTKDSVRQNQTRPDLRKYLLNSKHDKVPQHNQFNNQTDVVVDSNKFGNNIYGKLIRTGNTNFIVNEWTENLDDLKHKGQLYRIEGDLYYVATAKHTFYTSHIESEIEYSKDYNQLSQVIGIPSEPRFYEISEQSLIQREVALSDYLLLTDNSLLIDSTNTYLKTINHLSQLMFGGDSADFAKYVVSTFKGDKNTNPNDIVQGSNNFYKDIMSPLNAYSSQNTLTYEWDMVDNFSAGDKIDIAGHTGGVNPTADDVYKSLMAVQYTDVFGKAPLLDFYILEDLPNLSAEQVQKLPESPFRTKSVVSQDDPDYDKPFIGNSTLLPKILATNVVDLTDTDYNGRGLGLMKDCREAISINYNEELLTNSDTFVISPNVFTPNKANVKAVLLNTEVNKLSSGFIETSAIIKPFDTNGDQVESEYFDFTLTYLHGYPTFSLPISTIFADVNANHFGTASGESVEGFERVKAIAFVYDVTTQGQGGGIDIPYKVRLIVAKNIPNLQPYWGKTNATKDWFVGAPSKDALFTHKQ